MRNEESKLQKACVKYFRFRYPNLHMLLFHVPNGGYRTATTARNMKLEGVVAGVSDLILMIPAHGYHGLCIEMKTAKGRQSPKQKKFEQAVKAMGYCYVIVRSIDQFAVMIKEWIDDNK